MSSTVSQTFTRRTYLDFEQLPDEAQALVCSLVPALPLCYWAGSARAGVRQLHSTYSWRGPT